MTAAFAVMSVKGDGWPDLWVNVRVVPDLVVQVCWSRFVLGQLDVLVPAGTTLDKTVDVLWITTKATDLDDALAIAPAERVGSATVIPLLNGIDHRALRRTHSTVLAASIRVEAKQVGDGAGFAEFCPIAGPEI
jgi:2-dehydropantoate 2-reductase